MNSPESHFQRWREKGRPGDLAQVFDATAHDLLRLGFHLRDSLVDAEDLVQQTFLEAMKTADRWDLNSPVGPWLAGILRNQAASMRRRTVRGKQLELQHATAESTVDAGLTAEQRETAEVLLRAAEALDEPYRAAVLLKLRHGLSTTEVGNVLGRAPGTVRVQMHRALELLREKLPAGVMGVSPVVVLEPARGMTSIREDVVRQSGMYASTTSAGVGIAAIAALVTAVVCGVLLVNSGARGESGRSPEVDLAGLATEKPELRVPGVPSGDREVVEGASHDTTGILFYLQAPERFGPIRMSLYARPERSWAEFRSKWGSQLEIDPHGRPARQLAGRAFPIDVSDDVFFGDERVPVIELPDAGSKPWFVGMLNEEGKLLLPPGATSALAVLDGDRFGRRAYNLARMPFTMGGVEMLSFLPQPAHVVRGTVALPDGKPVGEAIELEVVSGYDGVEVADRMTAGADGRFEVRSLGGSFLRYFRSLDPRWVVVESEVPPQKERIIHVKRIPATVFKLRSVGSDEAPRSINALLIDKNGEALICGDFALESGIWAPNSFFSRHQRRAAASDGTTFIAWSDIDIWLKSRGHRLWFWSETTASEVHAGDLHEDRDIEVRLQATDTRVRGVVLRGNQPVVGARVRLIPAEPTGRRMASRATVAKFADSNARTFMSLGTLHALSDGAVVDSTKTDENGRFSLNGPQTALRLAVEDNGGVLHFDVAAEDRSPVTCDLDRAFDLRVDIREAESGMLFGRDVQLFLRGALVAQKRTEGRSASFANLERGDYEIHVATQPEGVSGVYHVERFTLGPEQSKRVDIVLPSTRAAFRARVAFEPGLQPASTSGWSVKMGSRWRGPTVTLDLEDDWTLTARSGRSMSLFVEAPDERRWGFPVPNSVTSEQVLRVGFLKGTMRGVLVEHDSGRKISGLRVRARGSKGAPGSSILVDGDGAFELTGLDPAAFYSLAFEPGSVVEAQKYQHPWSELDYVPNNKRPAAADELHRVILPPSGLVEDSDRVLELVLLGAAPESGERAAMIEPLWSSASGETRGYGDPRSASSSGEFELSVPDAPGHRIYLETGNGEFAPADRTGLEGDFRWTARNGETFEGRGSLR